MTAAVATRRPPTVVAVAAVLVALIAVIRLGLELADEAPVMGVVVFALYGLVAFGLWRGWRGAQWFAILGGALAVLGGVIDPTGVGILALVAGAALVVLVVAPESARRWFYAGSDSSR